MLVVDAGTQTGADRNVGAEARDDQLNVGVRLRGVKADQVWRGCVLAAPGSVKPHARFRASVYALTKAEGGRHTPFFSGYKPQFFVRTTSVVGEVGLGAPGIAAPGATIELTVTLGRPVALDAGLGFAIREGGKTVGAGTVTALLD